ncbi:MAG TPA: Asp-tRNA(Asn)/Glu-tRNA(Gln) amidotransferase subunit GatC [Thermoanaerobaculia bacterium]
MKITLDEARRVAALAHLEFDDDALARMAEEMSKILDYIDQLREIPLDDVHAPIAREPTPMREDAVGSSTPIDEVERNAPAFAMRHFIVPKVV